MGRDTPAPSLAAKLGITAGTRVRLDGTPDDALLAALDDADLVGPRANPDVVVALCRDEATLSDVLDRHDRPVSRNAPLWIVHPAGENAPLSEARIRETLREYGYVGEQTSAISRDLVATRYARRT